MFRFIAQAGNVYCDVFFAQSDDPTRYSCSPWVNFHIDKASLHSKVQIILNHCVIFRPHQTLVDIGTLSSLERFSLHLVQQFPHEMVATTLNFKVGGSMICVTLEKKTFEHFQLI